MTPRKSVSAGPTVASSKTVPRQNKEPFAVSLVSNFVRFEGAGHILHSAHEVRSQSQVNGAPLIFFGRIFPLWINEVRVGLELFTPQRAIMLGVNPEVTQSLYMHASRDKITVTILADHLKAKETLPLHGTPFFERISNISQKLLGLNIWDDYLGHLKSK